MCILNKSIFFIISIDYIRNVNNFVDLDLEAFNSNYYYSGYLSWLGA